MSARAPPPAWLSFLAALHPAHNDRADRPILRWQACRGQVNVKCSADILLALRALPDAIHPLHRRRPVAPPATPELLCLSVAVADEIRFACLCATLVVLRQSLTVAPRNLNGYLRVAHAEGAFGIDARRPFLGWLMLLEDCPASRRPTRIDSPHFPVRPEFSSASYAQRYDLLCKKIVQRDLYASSALVLSPRSAISDGCYREMSSFTSLRAFVASFAGHISTVASR